MAAIAITVTATGRAEAEERPDEVSVKSGATATGLAIGGTVAGFALMAAGGNAESEELSWLGLGVAVVGPAAGHFYAGEPGHGVLTSTLRAASIASFAVGFDMSFCLFDCSDVSVAQRRTGDLLVFAGLGMYAATTIYDLVDAHQAAGRANRRRAATAAPALLRTPDGGQAPGLVLAGSF